MLVEESDLDPLQAAFVVSFGAPGTQARVFAAFFQQRAAVSRDVPEALYYSETAALLFEGFFKL